LYIVRAPADIPRIADHLTTFATDSTTSCALARYDDDDDARGDEIDDNNQPKTQLAVLGHPAISRGEKEVADAACHHPSSAVREHVTVADRNRDLKNAFDDEEHGEHERERHDAFDRWPDQQYAKSNDSAAVSSDHCNSDAGAGAFRVMGV
jgi:hypothetical protein